MTKETQVRIGLELAAARDKKGWSQKKLHLETKIAKSTISKIETGYFDASIGTIETLADALGYKLPAKLLIKKR